ncbi:ribulokinase [Agarivorans sp. QJM3NY_29]|uniref:ribulokinase n=1 Tax=unclassified Agarivorans TaxID=2636026 RepID=UPI003D7E97AD
MDKQRYVIGLDFGSDSVRALIIGTDDGQEVGTSVSEYPRWMKGLYSKAEVSQFRHHPQDYIDAMSAAIMQALDGCSADVRGNIVGIGVDSTGSTPAPIDAQGRVLALLDEHKDNPNAMFILWKDHTSVTKAELINQLAHGGEFEDYTRYVGGVYSSEWFWAKAAWVAEQDPELAKSIYAWVELADWVPALLADNLAPDSIKRGICAGGHKALWHESWGGLPDQQFLSAISPSLDGMRERMYQQVFTADQVAGYLSEQWADKLGLPAGIAVAVGEFDCHMGAVGAGAGAHDLVKVMGTSTCDILMVDPAELGERTIEGICGQVLGSAMPELVALEAGQSAFGDLYAWYKRVLLWPLQQIAGQSSEAAAALKQLEQSLIPLLSEHCQAQSLADPVAMDWHNGRRTPFANQRLTGTVAGLNLGSSAPMIFNSLVEATAHGAKAIMDCFVNQQVEVKRVIAIGGIAKKSPLVMQTCADVMNCELLVMDSEQCCALGAGIFAAVAAGLYANTASAQQAMASAVHLTYQPNPERVAFYQQRHLQYRQLGESVENLVAQQGEKN